MQKQGHESCFCEACSTTFTLRFEHTSPASAKRAQQHSHCASSMLLLSMSSGLTFYSMYGTPGDSVSPYDCWCPRLLVFSDTLPPRSGNITVCITIHTLVRTLAHIRLPRKPVRSTASSTMATGHDSMIGPALAVRAASPMPDQCPPSAPPAPTPAPATMPTTVPTCVFQHFSCFCIEKRKTVHEHFLF